MGMGNGLRVGGRDEHHSQQPSESQLKLELARIRLEVRRLDAEISGLQRERRFFHRVGFGRDMKDIQLMAMRDQRDYLASKALDLERRLRPAPLRRDEPLAWLLLPVLLILLICQPLLPRRLVRQERAPIPTVVSPGSSLLAS